MKNLFVLVIACLLILENKADATTSRFTLAWPRPPLQSGDFIVTLGSNNLQKGRWSAATFLDYGWHPLELTQNGNRVRGIVDHLLVQHWGVGWGWNELFSSEIDIPVVWVNRFTNPDSATPASEAKMGLSDPVIRNRITFFRRDEKLIGFGFVHFLTIPAGGSGDFIGDRRITSGLSAVIDKNFGKKLSLGFNIGFEGREEIVLNDLDTGNRLTASLGSVYQLFPSWRVKGDIIMATPFEHPFANEIDTPTELFLGGTYSIPKSRLQVSFGGALSLIRAAGVPLFRIQTGLNWDHQAAKSR